jgi:hypothetical protein
VGDQLRWSPLELTDSQLVDPAAMSDRPGDWDKRRGYCQIFEAGQSNVLRTPFPMTLNFTSAPSHLTWYLDWRQFSLVAKWTRQGLTQSNRNYGGSAPSLI